MSIFSRLKRIPGLSTLRLGIKIAEREASKSGTKFRVLSEIRFMILSRSTDIDGLDQVQVVLNTDPVSIRKVNFILYSGNLLIF